MYMALVLVRGSWYDAVSRMLAAAHTARLPTISALLCNRSSCGVANGMPEQAQKQGCV